MTRSKTMPFRPGRTLALGLAIVLLAHPVSARMDPAAPSDTTGAGSPFFSAEDGMLDISRFMEGRYGFVPVAFPITEPAVGYGAGAMLGFVDKPRSAAQAGFGRPNVTLVGGLATENGTWAVMAADIRYWRQDRLKTLMAAATASLELDYGGVGTMTERERPLLHYALASRFVTLQAMSRIGGTRLWAGLRYAFAASDVAFEVPESTPGLPGHSRKSDVGSLAPSLIYDSRDNNFTPLSGTYAEVYSGLYRDWLGSDDEFESLELTAIQYFPLAREWFLGLRADTRFVQRGAPFYVLPYVEMRGVAAMRYQGEQVAQAQAELRWQCLGRWSVVGFAGAGTAVSEHEGLGGSSGVWAGGAGFRYELARSFGIHAGMDVAWGPDETAIYFQTGSAWGRP